MSSHPRVALLASLFVVICLSFLNRAATRQDPSCPVIKIRCSSEKSCCGPKYAFAVDITGGYLDRKPTYKWTVSAGKITNGQGTSEIQVDATCANGKPLKITVEIGNVIPVGCPTTSSYVTECDKP